jgi:hypothetical protein
MDDEKLTFILCFKAHKNMTAEVKRVKHSFTVPREVKKYMSNPVDEIIFSFIDPTEALVRLLVMSPIAGCCLTSV